MGKRGEKRREEANKKNTSRTQELILLRNWGLVTYREIALLAEATSSVQTKQRVAYVVAHECKFPPHLSLCLRFTNDHFSFMHTVAHQW